MPGVPPKLHRSGHGGGGRQVCPRSAWARGLAQPLQETPARLSSMAIPRNRSHVRIAWVVAVLVDGLQLITAPAEWTGPVVWVVEAGVDLVTMGVMMFLVGFHWAFLPSLVTKFLPFIDLAPTWTVALFIATRDRKKLAPPTEGRHS